jgi:general stress protein 26
MDQSMRRFILELLAGHNVMTIATLRPDGWPQATTVKFASDGLTIYFCCDPNAQKLANIARTNKVSLTVDRDYDDWSKIKALSMAATAEAVTDKQEVAHALGLLARKFPDHADVFKPDPGLAVVRVTPKVISVLNYEQEFGHTDLVEV